MQVIDIENWYHEKALNILENTQIPADVIPLLIMFLNKERNKKLEESESHHRIHRFKTTHRIKIVAACK